MMQRLHALFFKQRTGAAYARKFSLKDPEARLVMADLSSYCNFDRTTACVTSTGTIDALAMAYAEGRRDAFLYILRQSRADLSDVQTAIETELQNAA